MVNVRVFSSDHRESYRELIPAELLCQSKAENHGIERTPLQAKPLVRTISLQSLYSFPLEEDR